MSVQLLLGISFVERQNLMSQNIQNIQGALIAIFKYKGSFETKVLDMRVSLNKV